MGDAKKQQDEIFYKSAFRGFLFVTPNLTFGFISFSVVDLNLYQACCKPRVLEAGSEY